MASYTVKSPIKVNGRRHAPGARMDMADDVARPLLDAGAIAKAEPGKKEPEPKK
jgi:hypothetical protein